MMRLTCLNHPKKRWYIKAIAWTVTGPREGYYNQSRNIFYAGEIKEDGITVDDTWHECSCPACDLRLAPETTETDIHAMD